MLSDGEEGFVEGVNSFQADSRTALTIDEMLSLHVGGIGRAQVKHFVLSSVAWVPAVFLTLMSVFTARIPAWRCKLGDGCGDADICSLHDEDWEWVSKSASIVSEWNLICSEEWKVSAADSMFFVGFFFGAGVIGQLADISGRRPAMYLSLLIGGIGAAISAASFGFWQYFSAGSSLVLDAGIGVDLLSSALNHSGPSGVPSWALQHSTGGRLVSASCLASRLR